MQNVNTANVNAAVSKTEKDTIYDDLGILHKKKEQKKDDASEIGDFMTLFLAQLRNQDPLDPQDGAEFVAQLAQFNTVESLHKIDDSVKNMSETFKSSRILEATSMIGKSIQVKTNKMTLNSEPKTDANGQIYLEASPVQGEMHLPNINENLRPGDKARIIDNVRITIKNVATGQVVQETNLGPAVPGRTVPIFWDATYQDPETGQTGRILDGAGNPIADGQYEITAEAFVGKDRHPVRTTIATPVDSISIDNGNIRLNATNVGSVSLNELKQVTENNKDPLTREQYQEILSRMKDAANQAIEQQSSRAALERNLQKNDKDMRAVRAREMAGLPQAAQAAQAAQDAQVAEANVQQNTNNQ